MELLRLMCDVGTYYYDEDAYIATLGRHDFYFDAWGQPNPYSKFHTTFSNKETCPREKNCFLFLFRWNARSSKFIFKV
jgi:hypothetical protein